MVAAAAEAVREDKAIAEVESVSLRENTVTRIIVDFARAVALTLLATCANVAYVLLAGFVHSTIRTVFVPI